jgi:polyribonucleotide nucleotidyltransferase
MFNKVETEIGGKTISIETGKIAKQASGSVVIRSGDTMVLVTVVGAGSSKPDADFLPLTIEYQEKLASVGRIPGNYFRREIGRPSDNEVLTCRIIDRPLRPLFPKGYSAETQVIATVLSADQHTQPDVLALTGASCALTISNVPFDGPVAGGRIGYVDGKYILNPTIAELAKSSMDIIVACTRKAVVMVEGKVDELSEDEVLSGIFYAFEHLQPLIDIQEELQKSAGKTKAAVEAPQVDEALLAKVREVAAAGMEKVFNTSDKLERSKGVALFL